MALLLNTITGNFYPQYHVVFDDTFSTVYHKRKEKVTVNWKTLVEEHPEFATQENFTLEKEWHLKKYSSIPLPRDACKEIPLETGPQDLPPGYDTQAEPISITKEPTPVQ